jgi:serine kinase of HPr protein (carbohydrate metabolism regulator)
VIVHAGLVAMRLQGLWRGALITGSSGAGKSDLMLRAMECGFRLIADDRTVVWASSGRLFGRAPDALHGRIEARHLGILAGPALSLAEAALVVRCAPPGAELERLPENEAEEVDGVALPLLRLRSLEASAPLKLACALKRLGQKS